MDFKQIVGRARGWLLETGISLAVKYALRLLAEEGNRNKVRSLGNSLGRRLGQLIPSEEADGFAAAFMRGFAAGLEETDGPGQGGTEGPFAPSSSDTGASTSSS